MSNVEYLTEDQIIPSQQYVCLSFVEPSKDLLEAKEDFFMKQFLKQYQKDMYLDFCVKNNIDHEKAVEPSFTDKQIDEMYTAFKENNFDNMQLEFSQHHKHRTNVRGIKIRGSYTTFDEAKARAEKLRRDDNAHHIFVGQVGFWLPFNPINLENVEQDYVNNQLNDLIKEKKIADIKAKEHFQHRQQELIHKQMEQNNVKTSNELDETNTDNLTVI